MCFVYAAATVSPDTPRGSTLPGEAHSLGKHGGPPNIHVYCPADRPPAAESGGALRACDCATGAPLSAFPSGVLWYFKGSQFRLLPPPLPPPPLPPPPLRPSSAWTGLGVHAPPRSVYTTHVPAESTVVRKALRLAEVPALGHFLPVANRWSLSSAAVWASSFHSSLRRFGREKTLLISITVVSASPMANASRIPIWISPWSPHKYGLDCGPAASGRQRLFIKMTERWNVLRCSLLPVQTMCFLSCLIFPGLTFLADTSCLKSNASCGWGSCGL